MSGDFWRRRRRDFIDEIDRLFEEIFERIERRMRDLVEKTPLWEDIEPEWREEIRPGEEKRRERSRRFEYHEYGPYIYGFSITIGPDGKPIIREFGNVKRGRRPVVREEEFEEERRPFIDVFERGDEVVVVAEVPGVDEDKINVKVLEDKKTLVIDARGDRRKYYEEVDLPAKVDPSSIKTTYKNGVLEVTLKKTSDEGRETRGVRV